MENDTKFVAIEGGVYYFLHTGDDKKIDGNERTGHAPPTSPPSNKAPPTTTTATPTPSTKASDITKEAISSTTQQPLESHSDSKPSSSSNSGTGSSSDHTSGSGETPPTKQSSAKAGVEVGGVDKSALNQGKGRDGNSDVRECGKHGCDGSGVIAIVVVASICFVIIVLVVAVLLKKVITDNRRRRFKNVDYLINGMYT